MNDPHVEYIRYRLEVDELYGRFENPPPLDHETDAYRMRLENGVLTIEMKEHHPTVDSARGKVEPDLKAWELNTALSRDHAWLKFVFDPDGTRIVGSKPIYPQLNVNLVASPATLSAIATFTPPASKEYPRPPIAFKASPELEVLIEDYQKTVWDDESQLLTFGYKLLSHLEGTTGWKEGARKAVARMYQISDPVRAKLGDILSERGDMREARKLDVGATLVPLTPEEKRWVRAAIITLLRRKAEYDRDPSAASSLPEITMEDLPEL
jgi:hypothetical protein